jgi:DNA adenine methylase
MQSFLIWIGNKRRILPAIIEHLPTTINNYYEPFLGSGEVFFGLAAEKLIDTSKSVLSDTQIGIYATMEAVRSKLPLTIQLLTEHELNHSKEYFNDLKVKVFSTIPEVAAQFIYLSRAGFSGIYRENSNSLYNVTMRKNEQPRWAERVYMYGASGYLSRAKVLCRDFRVILDEDNGWQKDDFIYCDPPYHSWFEKKERSVYNHRVFNLNDQIHLLAMLRRLDKRGVKWMISNSMSTETLLLYKDYNIKKIPITYKVTQQQKKGNKTEELIVTNY